MDKKEQIDILIEKIEYLNYHYYTLDEPLVSDGEYDQIYDELRKLEEETGYVRDDSPTQIVGGEILDKFEKHFHITKLLSQNKAQTHEELEAWIDRCNRLRDEYNRNHDDKLAELEYIMEYKFDGLTVNLSLIHI